MRKIISGLLTALTLLTLSLTACSKGNEPVKEITPNSEDKQEPKKDKKEVLIIKADGKETIFMASPLKKTLPELLKAYEGKDIEQITIAGRTLNQGDLDFFTKKVKSITVLDLTKATLSIGYEDYGFKTNKTIKKLILPMNLTTLGLGHVAYTTIEEVIFTGEKLISLEDGAFSFSNNIKTLKLPNSLISLDKNALAYMTGLEEIELPKELNIIPDFCFSRDLNLKSVVFNGEIFQLGNGVFAQCAKLTKIKFTQSTPPTFIAEEWPFVEAEYLTNSDGTPRLHFYIPKGSLQAYLKAWKFEGKGDEAYFIEY